VKCYQIISDKAVVNVSFQLPQSFRLTHRTDKQGGLRECLAHFTRSNCKLHILVTK